MDTKQISDYTALSFAEAIALKREIDAEIGNLTDMLFDVALELRELKGKCMQGA